MEFNKVILPIPTAITKIYNKLPSNTKLILKQDVSSYLDDITNFKRDLSYNFTLLCYDPSNNPHTKSSQGLYITNYTVINISTCDKQ